MFDSRNTTAGKWLPQAAALISIFMLNAQSERAAAQEIWFGPNQTQEFTHLFQPTAPWQRAAPHIKALEISDPYAFSAPEGDLRNMYSDLRRRGIDLVVGLLPLSGGPGGCGHGVEGYAAPGESYAVAERVKKLGGTPKYFSLDGPLYFGHSFDRDGETYGCHSSIDEIARDVAFKTKQVRLFFPGVAIGDVEPATVFSDAELEEWFDDYETLSGTKLAFLRLDMDWKSDWRRRLPSLIRLLKRKNVPLQVIYNASGVEGSDETWIAAAQANFRAFEGSIAPAPSVVMIQSWNPHPTRLLPDDDPLTLTGLINSYVTWRNGRR
jgi:hypothetical protein